MNPARFARFGRNVLPALLLLCFSAATAHAELVTLQASISGSAANAWLRVTFLGSDVLRLDGAAAEETSVLDLPLDEPALLQVTGEGVGDFRLVLTPPAQLTPLVGGVRQGGYISTHASPRPVYQVLPVTLVQRGTTGRATLALGQASSIAWHPPKILGSRAPYIDFEVGAALNGDPLPPLRIPLLPRGADSEALPVDLPDSLYAPAVGGFELITPQVVARLTLDPQTIGSFWISFHTDAAAAPYARYHFQFPVWPGHWSASRQVRVVSDGSVDGTGRNYETTLNGYFTDAGMLHIAPSNTWTVADWRVIGQSPLRFVQGRRDVIASGGTETTPGAWYQTGVWHDTIEVRAGGPGGEIAELSRYVYHSFDRWGGDPLVPPQSVFVLQEHVAGSAPKSYSTLHHQDPRAPSVHGSRSPAGLVRLTDSDSFQEKTYTTWLDQSPGFVPTAAHGAQIAPNNSIRTTTQFETSPALFAYRLPVSIISESNGTRIGRNDTAYSLDGEIVRAVRTQHASSAPGDAVTSVARWFRPDATVAALRGRPVSIRQPGGAQWSFAYRISGTELQVATLVGADSGGIAVTSLPDFGPVDEIRLLPMRSTLTVETFSRGLLVRRETRVYLGGAGSAPTFNSGAPVAWEDFEYTVEGRIRRRTASDNTRYSAEWSGARMLSQSDETGLVTTFRHDPMDRILVAETEAAADQPARAVAFVYDAAHRVRTRRVGASDADGFPLGEQLVTEYRYDHGGRPYQRTDPGGATDGGVPAPGIVTDIAHANGDRDITETRGDATFSVRRFNDGRLRDISGTAALPPRVFAYSVESSGWLLSQVTLGAVRSQLTFSDWLGRTREQRRNGVIQADGQSRLIVTTHRFNVRGLLATIFEAENQGSSWVPYGAERVYEYDEFGSVKASGLNLNGEAGLQPSSSDRMTVTESRYFQDASQAWWVQSTTHVYHTNGNNAAHTGQQFRRLTQFTPNQSDQIDRLDYYNNRSSIVTTFNASQKTRTVSVQATDSTRRVAVSTGGLTISEQRISDAGAAEQAAVFAYDNLGRLRQQTSPRGIVTRLDYHFGTLQPRRQFTGRNAAGQEIQAAEWTYDALGRITSNTDAEGRTTTSTYHPSGLLKDRGGSGSYPIRYVYDPFGQLTELSTYRNGPGGPPDRTTWSYDPHTGWPTGRKDAAQRETRLTYATAYPYQIVTRLAPRDGLSTAYRHRLDTGELASVDYSDSTPDLAFTYTRTGKLDTASDATGSRDYFYDRERLAAEFLGAWYGNLVLTSLPDDTTVQNPSSNRVPGRAAGFALGYVPAGPGAPPTQDMARELKVSWGYDDLGRPETVAVSHAGQTAAAFTYAYTSNSSFWRTRTSGSFQHERVPESTRDVLQTATTRWQATMLAQHEYRYSEAGAVRELAQQGTLFADYGSDNGATTHAYAYHATGELHTATSYAGAVNGPALPGRNLTYTYDSAGNRRTFSAGAASGSHTDEANNPGANALNQVRVRNHLPARITGTSHPEANVTIPGATVIRTPGQRYWDSVLESWGRYADLSVSALRNTVTHAATATRLIRPYREALEYDQAGNLVADALWTYQYDAEDRLIRMATRSRAEMPALQWQSFPPEREVRFKYDHLGRRVEKIALKDNVVTYQRRYIYDGWSLIGEFELINGTPVMRRTYAWGLDVSGSTHASGGIGGLVLQTIHTGATRAHYHVASDGHGNVTALIDANGGVAAAYEYDPFGQLLRAEGASANEHLSDADLPGDNPFRYSSKYWDRETGLYDYGHRFYDPSMGRFLNRDPIGEAGGTNLYAFAGNDPVNRWDYLGLEGASKKFQPHDFDFGWTPDMPAEDGSFTRDRDSNAENNWGMAKPFGTDSPNSADTAPFPRSPTAVSTLTGRAVASDSAIASHGLPGDPVFAHQVRDASLSAASILLPGGGAALLVRTAAGRVIVHLIGVGQFIADPDDPLNSIGALPAKGAATAMTKGVTDVRLRQLQRKLDELAEERLLPQFRVLDPNLKAGYNGSFKSGRVGNPNKSTLNDPIDLDDYDIDYWIESDILLEKFGPNLRAAPEFRKALSETPGFEGLRPNKKGFSIKFLPSGSSK
ncbi:MAG TPA: hypothetical protein DIT64_06600 [Verrucomicrobiales bacterium]|nr:hypothetical protein [Verrucomicrobiales bacterium]